MTDPVVQDTNRYHTQLEQEAIRVDEAEALAFKRVERGEFGRQEIQDALYRLTQKKERVFAQAIGEKDFVEAGWILRELLAEHLVEEILDNDY